MRRALVVALLAAPLVFASAIVACGGTDGGVGPGDGDGGGGSETSPPTDGGGGTDATDDAEIRDGGANIDPDAASQGDDAGPDGGPCNTIANTAPAISSSCISFKPPFEGGALVAGTYYLTAAAVLGSKAFCANTFIPVGFRETLDVTVDATGAGTGEIAFQVAGGTLQHRTIHLAPGAGNTSPATAQSTCPTGNPGAVEYTSALRVNNKQILSLLLPYGTNGAAVYRFEKQ